MTRAAGSRLQPVALTYVLAVIALGACTMYWLRPTLASSYDLFKVVSFGLVIFITEAMPVDLPRGKGTVSVSYAVIFATVVVFGPEVATWLAALATLRLRELRGQISIEKVLFNRSQLALSAAAAGLAYVGLGGVPGAVSVVNDALALLGAAVAYSFVNITTVVVVMTLTQRTPFWRVWITDFKWMIPHYLALTPLGVLIAIVQIGVGLAGVLLLFVPLLVARFSLQLYAQMRNAYLATIQAMVAAIEARDPYTAGHSRRVATYTVATARLLRLPEEQIERLEYSAWLHDVGKLAIPDRILQKRGPLTQAEWELMKKHPETGANILRQIKLLGQDVQVILHHHERWDGAGYPSRLETTEIPLGARLIAIADAYEAMTSARPYRRQLTKEEALTELDRCAGNQFDPTLVAAFARAVLDIPVPSDEVNQPAPVSHSVDPVFAEVAVTADSSTSSQERTITADPPHEEDV